ncbi:MAG: 4-hydroxy-tetrahydrodipicolinate reductase [Clostridioides difficile]|nr:4-hydroxy-tetrahydrodipicolinate reductase [Clostridioides sp.]MBS5787248.1 4-hydroxy-tetrahydrodipicolinate reductase [Clostridioides difficile]
MLKIIVSGYNGTNGTILTKCIDENENLELVCGVSRSLNNGSYDGKNKLYKRMDYVEEKCDVIIDFSHPSNLDSILKYALSNKTPIVLATTGYSQEDLDQIDIASKQIPILLSSNTSLGVNIFIELVKNAATLLKNFDIEIIDKHHNRKEDAPSGTASMLANAIKEVHPEKYNTYGRHGRDAKRNNHEIGIHAIRGGTIVSDHDVIFAGDSEVLTLTHEAQSDVIFAKGSLAAAEYLQNKTDGLYEMKDVLNIN